MENINTILLAAILLSILTLLISLIISINNSVKKINSQIEIGKIQIIKAIDENRATIKEDNKKIIETLNEVTLIE